jgi:prephenate dehydrogenase
MNVAIIGLGLIGGSIALDLGVYEKGEKKFELNKQNWIKTKLIIK